MFNAAMVHYDLDTASVIRFIQGEYTGAHRDIDHTLSEVHGEISDSDYEALERILRTGCPHKLRIEISSEQKKAFIEYGNHPSLEANPKKMDKTGNKEERNSHLFCISKIFCEYSMKISPIP